MKNLCIGIIAVYLFVYFLIYAGFFRDNQNPVKVTEFYFECMKNNEWMLTYEVTKPERFDSRKLIRLRNSLFRGKTFKSLEAALLNREDNFAQVQVQLSCKDNELVKARTILERNDENNWLVTEVLYSEP